MAHRGVEDRREAERDAHARAASPRRRRGSRSIDDAELLEHVGRSARGRRRAVAVLDDRGAGGRAHQRGHRRDVHGVRPVAAGADDVDTTRPVESEIDAAARSASPTPGRRPRPPSRPWPAARRGTPAICAGVASPVRISAIAQAVASGVEVVAGASQRGQHRRPGWTSVIARVASSGASGDGEAASQQRRYDGRRARTASSGWPTTASARDQVASQASCGRPTRTRIGGQR